MEIIIAILWYLQLLVPGTTYSQEQVDTLMNDNINEINAIMASPTQTGAVIDYYEATWDGTVGVACPPDIGKKHTEPIWER